MTIEFMCTDELCFSSYIHNIHIHRYCIQNNIVRVYPCVLAVGACVRVYKQLTLKSVEHGAETVEESGAKNTREDLTKRKVEREVYANIERYERRSAVLGIVLYVQLWIIFVSRVG